MSERSLSSGFLAQDIPGGIDGMVLKVTQSVRALRPGPCSIITYQHAYQSMKSVLLDD
jgi:hypothetical protein